jgi:hypothetical protein
MTLFTVHHVDEPRGTTNLSFTWKNESPGEFSAFPKKSAILY